MGNLLGGASLFWDGSVGVGFHRGPAGPPAPLGLGPTRVDPIAHHALSVPDSPSRPGADFAIDFFVFEHPWPL
jgi:hypothetical protein